MTDMMQFMVVRRSQVPCTVTVIFLSLPLRQAGLVLVRVPAFKGGASAHRNLILWYTKAVDASSLRTGHRQPPSSATARNGGGEEMVRSRSANADALLGDAKTRLLTSPPVRSLART
jgi:hypothetical protein